MRSQDIMRRSRVGQMSAHYIKPDGFTDAELKKPLIGVVNAFNDI